MWKHIFINDTHLHIRAFACLYVVENCSKIDKGFFCILDNMIYKKYYELLLRTSSS